MPRLREPIDPNAEPVRKSVRVEVKNKDLLFENKKPEDKLFEAAPPDDETVETVEVEPKEQAKTASEEATEALAKQLDDPKKAKEVSDREKQDAIRQAQEHAKKAMEWRDQAESALSEADQAKYDAVLNAIGAVQAEIDSAKKDYETAGQATDWTGMATANERIAKASSRLTQLEDGKANLEYRQAQAKAEKPKQEPIQQIGDPIENHINSMPSLLDSERTWLKSHRELMTDMRKNARLQSAYFDAEDAGVARGTPEYFDFIEQKLGYKKAPETTKKVETDPEERMPIVAAPVSRETTSTGTGKPVSTRITLTPSQREAARASGVTEMEYAKQLIKFQQAKENGQIQ